MIRKTLKRSSLTSVAALLVTGAAALAQGAGDPATVTAADEATAKQFLPYVTMACAAYTDCTQTKYLGKEYRAESLSWQQTLKLAAGNRDVSGLVSTFERAGFSAQIFRNDQTREIVITMRGSEGDPDLKGYVKDQLRQAAGFAGKTADSDWQADYRARFNLKSGNERLEAQYVAARLLARSLDKVYGGGPYANYTHVLTGHSLGGGLSLYAGKFVNAEVYAVEPAGNVLSAGERSPRQHIIIGDKDVVSDPRSPVSKLSGASKFQGQIYTVGLASEKTSVNPVDTIIARHDKNAMVTRTAAIADGSARVFDYHPGQSPLGSTSATTPQRMEVQPKLPATSSAGLPAFSNNAPKPDTPARSPASPASPGTQTALRSPQTGFQAPAPAPRNTPGGILLSRAAAERMPLQIAIEGSYYSNGRLVLMGKPDPTGIDAALFLTSLRLACESSDPFFSLDPDEGAAWSREGRQATETFWERIGPRLKQQPNVRRKDDSFSIRTISARRDYPEVWAAMADNYPHLRSKLVFRPQWLAQTRFGEILYRADVLLKELSGGVPVLEPGALRAAKVASYVPADARFTARGLLRRYEGGEALARPEWQGSRLWFDLRSDAAPNPIEAALDRTSCTAGEAKCRPSALRKILDARGLTTTAAATPVTPAIAREGNAIDMSRVFPQMFVRQHDHATRTDLAGTEPSQTTLAADVNRSIESYVGAYKELRALTDIFRAYVSAVHVVRQDAGLCDANQGRSLLESEKTASVLPAYHPTELFFTLAAFEYNSGRQRILLSNRGYSLNGGVSIGARTYMADGLRTDTATEITKIMNANGAAIREDSSWSTADKRQFVVLTLDVPKPAAVSSPAVPSPAVPVAGPAVSPPPPAPIAPRPSAAAGPDDYEIENEPSPAQLPQRLRR
jgi:hypothetical protein